MDLQDRAMSPEHHDVSRRGFLAGSGGVLGALTLGALPAFAQRPAPARPERSPLAESALTLWYPQPADPATLIQQALPVGNGRLGALVGGDPAADRLLVTDCTLWTGGRNASLGPDGQFPYSADDFGTFTLLADVLTVVPDHTMDAVTDYRRSLDLTNGLVSASYRKDGTTFRRTTFASEPDDVIVIRLTAEGRGRYTGTLALSGRHGETPTVDGDSLAFVGQFDNGLRYAALVMAAARGGRVTATESGLAFTDCRELTVVVSGGTNYRPDPAAGYLDADFDPLPLARHKAAAAARASGERLVHTHVADYRRLFDRFAVSLGRSTEEQRRLDTWARLNARAQSGIPDPELEASYLQYGRYLMICGSRDRLPLNLQGLWLDRNDPAWMSDYHTDINVQMNYWLADRAALGECFTAFADYCLDQLPSWTELTQTLFNDPRNGFRNSSGRIAGWTLAISTNVYGGLCWWWHPAGNAWIANSLWQHFEYTHDLRYLARIYPLLKGACEFWQARLRTTTVDGREVLIDDSDWSPEQGPTDAKGITYAQELVWDLFGHYVTATDLLARDRAYGRTIAGLRERLYLPEVSPKTGWLEEWMTPDNLGDPTHRHLSPLFGLFPGDRITVDQSPADLLGGAKALLTARGMQSFGWGCAWRAICWARFKDAEKAYQEVATNLAPSVHNSNGTAANFFDIYSFGASSSTFQIDANFGTPTAMIEMLLYSRPDVIELLPALPAAWSECGAVRGIGARGGFVVDLAWRQGRVSRATVRSVGGRRTQVRVNGRTHHLQLRPGQTVAISG
jgi:alpha-L-fucosidase 2